MTAVLSAKTTAARSRKVIGVSLLMFMGMVRFRRPSIAAAREKSRAACRFSCGGMPLELMNSLRTRIQSSSTGAVGDTRRRERSRQPIKRRLLRGTALGTEIIVQHHGGLGA